jgi:hypothetical protein
LFEEIEAMHQKSVRARIACARLLVALFGVLHGAAGVAHEAHTPAEATLPPPLAARFTQSATDPDGRITRSPDWWLVRDAHSIVAGSPSAGQRERWTRDPATREVSLVRVFDADRRAVEYAHGDLVALRGPGQWAAMAHVIDPQSLGAYRAVGESEVFGRRALLLEAVVGREVVRVTWLPELALAARIERAARDGSGSVFELVALSTTDDAAWAPLIAEPPDDYERIDAADFGDREADPFVQRVEALDARTQRWRRGGAPHMH